MSEAEKNDSHALPRPAQQLEEKIGYHFRNPAYLREALTHSSYANESASKSKPCPCNERLEFLGDSVLSLITSEYLYTSMEALPEGELTKIRASLVCEEALYDYATDLHLSDYLYLGHGEAKRRGAHKSVIADAFEALLAAIYLDSGESKECVAQFLLPYLIHAVKAPQSERTKDYKTLLQQIVQQTHGEILEYVLVGQHGPDHDRMFETEARLNSNVIGRGSGKSKRESEQMAAREALLLFGEKI